MAIDWDKINRRFWRLNRIEQETYARFQMQKTREKPMNGLTIGFPIAWTDAIQIVLLVLILIRAELILRK